jgi:quercetin dioxygenase-like cupin family protein
MNPAWKLLAIPLLCATAAGAQIRPSPGKASANLAAAKVFAYDAMAVSHAPNGSERRSVVSGMLASGEPVEMHESMQVAGLPPNPAHAIAHSEFILVQEGTMEFIHDGKRETAGPGSVIYVAYGTMHQARNVGKGTARYTVIAIGGDAK